MNILAEFIKQCINEALNINDVEINHIDTYNKSGNIALVWATLAGFHDSKYGQGMNNIYAMPDDFDPTSVVGKVKLYMGGGYENNPVLLLLRS